MSRFFRKIFFPEKTVLTRKQPRTIMVITSSTNQGPPSFQTTLIGRCKLEVMSWAGGYPPV
ncbi:hypothetical protein C0Q70_08104 [Pomacea canaliculata]|uniref:Uncharacterized protein n=1 Tax=Pomacea canaliculata TaxID=400727 RepID=A0A2T7PGW2_POMCA|nr:hypothetical protein C0Q70_08104 [Pomacea canaliculata]